MQTPPPPPPPMMPPMPQRSSNRTLWIVLSVIGGLCCLMLIGGGYFLFSAFKQAVPLVTCSMKMEDVRSALRSYADAHDGHLPKAATWEDDIQKEITEIASRATKDTRPFGSLVAGETLGCKFNDESTGIWFNSDLSGVKFGDIKDRSSTVLVYQTKTVQRNGNAPYKPVTDQGPKFFGTNLGWLIVPIDGEADMVLPDGTRKPIRTR